MKKLKLIYNPFSGNRSFKFDLDVCIKIFQEGGFDVHIFRTTNPGDIEKHIQKMEADYDVVVVSGGDGTVNLVVNALMHRGLKIPLGIIPSGTANDFATFLNFRTDDLETCCRAVIQTEPKEIDVGVVNGRYFINVCGGGILTNVSQNIDREFKNTFGTLAYYIKGIEQIPNFEPISLRITNSKEVIEESVYLFLVLNSAGAGSFDRLSPQASITDGNLDFVAVKAKPVYELAVLFVKILRGEHIGDQNIIFFRDHKIKVECLSENRAFTQTDIDGEAGPDLPIEIEMIPKAIPVFTNFPNKKIKQKNIKEKVTKEKK